MPKNLALCFDGTWNKPVNQATGQPVVNLAPEDDGSENPENTNVVKIKRLMGPDSSGQVVVYFNGVGTAWYDHIRGGISGEGLSDRIRLGYQRLAERFEPGDRIFLFGFSRGAYTARSLGGMIRKCGILRRGALGKLEAAFDLYQRRDSTPDPPDAQQFRAENSVVTDIQFIGVWDTVGALGIPFSAFNFINREVYGFHDTNLSAIVKNAFHALAIDEHRKQFAPTLWTSDPAPGQTVEQRWFIGAHSNVGGGYPDDRLSNIALAWMCRNAAAAGLQLAPFTAGPNDYQGEVHDSYAEFIGGLNWLYRLFNRPLYRTMTLG